nr:putative reverse transcriptase domain-containing protein [Tanacetum cinerariifolium]
MTLPEAMKANRNNRTRAKIPTGLTLRDLVKRNHMEGLNLYALSATITTMVHVPQNATSATRKDCSKFKNNNHGTQGGNVTTSAKVYAVGRTGTNPDSNVVTGTFLLNNRYDSILFDTGADRSFVSTAFSSQIASTLTTLDHYYDVKLADGRIIGLKSILMGCTLNFLNHPFNIDLILVELGSFDAIIGTDWLAKYHAVIVCAEKIVRIPLGNEILIVHGDGSEWGNKTRLNIISCAKTQNTGTLSISPVRDEKIVRPTEGAIQKRLYKTQFLTLGSTGLVCQEEGWIILNVMPFVLTNASMVFMDLMNRVYKPYLDEFVIFFIDDILIYSKNKKEHKEHLKAILELLKKEELNAKFSKCEFWIPKVQFLDHMIDSQGIHVDPAMIDSIKDWASLKTPTEIHQFLGLAGYYRRFIEGFSKIGKSMTKLTQKGVKFDWGEKQEAAFSY